MKTNVLSTGSALWWPGGVLHSHLYCLEQIIYSQYAINPTWRVGVVTFLLSFCVACLGNKLFWLSIFSYIKEQLQAQEVPCLGCDV